MIPVYWNCGTCLEQGVIEIPIQFIGPIMVQIANCDHARKSPECGYEFK